MTRLLTAVGVDAVQWRILTLAFLKIDFAGVLGAYGQKAAQRSALTLIVTASILISSMVADTVEESEISTGRRSEGVFFAARSFIMKSVHGVGVMSATMILVVIDFPQGAQPGDVDASIVASLGLIYVPAILVLYVMSVAFVAAYRISRAGHEANVQRLTT